MIRPLRSSASVAMLAASVVSAFAGTLDISGMVPGKSRLIDVAFYGNVAQVDAGPQAAAYDGRSFEGYCIDLTHSQPVPNSFAATPVAASGFLPNGDRIAKLVNQYSAAVTDRDSGAALQLAIWDVLIDGGDGADAGDFRASNLSASIQAQFASLLADPLAGVSNVAIVYNPVDHGPNGTHNQGLIEAVPEPASLGALALAGLALFRRRHRA